MGHPPTPALLHPLLSHPLIQSITHNPLNLLLLSLLLYLLVPILAPGSLARLTPTLNNARSNSSRNSDAYSYLPAEHAACTEWQRYTPRSLAIYDGTGAGAGAGEAQTQGKILLAINRKVFDVTSGGRFYGPGGPYGNFAGRDASRGMAKQSFDQEMLTPLDKPIDSLADLTHAEVTAMKDWESHFTAKYPVVGELVENGEA